MTNPRDPEVPGSASSEQATIDAYVEQNLGRYTDEAVLAALVQAGHSADDVRRSIAGATARERPASTGRRAVGIIAAAYVGTFLLLSAGMLANAGMDSGQYMPDAAGGIGILFGSLAVMFVLSLFWVASRRAFLMAALVGAVAVGLAQYLGGGAVAAIVVVGAIGGIWLLARRPAGGARAEAALATLLIVPMLGLVVVGGICVASGLPIPRPG